MYSATNTTDKQPTKKKNVYNDHLYFIHYYFFWFNQPIFFRLGWVAKLEPVVIAAVHFLQV